MATRDMEAQPATASQPGTDLPGAPSSGEAPPVAADWHPADVDRPPIHVITVCSMALVIIGGIYLASYLPARAPLSPAIGLLAASGALLVTSVVMVARLRDFAWDAFFLVLRWALLAYVVIAGMLEYVFVLDGTRGSMLVILTLSLLVFAVDIPVLLAFTVARFQVPGATTARS